MSIWYAVCIGEYDEDLGYGSENYGEASAMARELSKCYPEDNIYLYKVDMKDSFVLGEENY